MHYIVVVVEFAVGDGNGRGGHDCIDEPIGAVRQGHVVDPDIGRTEHGDGVTVTNGTEPEVEDRVPNKTTRGRDNVVNPDVVYYDILMKLDSNASTMSNVDIYSSTVNGLVTSDEELLM